MKFQNGQKMKFRNSQYALVLKRQIFNIKKHGCTHKCIFGRFKTVAYYEFQNTVPLFVTKMQQKRR